MLEQAFQDVYTKFKLHFYQNIFQRFATREATLTTVESFLSLIHISAVEAGQTAASRIGEVVSALVIPRPHASVSEDVYKRQVCSRAAAHH